jgi:hypothetical protein
MFALLLDANTASWINKGSGEAAITPVCWSSAIWFPSAHSAPSTHLHDHSTPGPIAPQQKKSRQRLRGAVRDTDCSSTLERAWRQNSSFGEPMIGSGISSESPTPFRRLPAPLSGKPQTQHGEQGWRSRGRFWERACTKLLSPSCSRPCAEKKVMPHLPGPEQSKETVKRHSQCGDCKASQAVGSRTRRLLPEHLASISAAAAQQW